MYLFAKITEYLKAVGGKLFANGYRNKKYNFLDN